MLNYTIVILVVVMIYISYRFYKMESNISVSSPHKDVQVYGLSYNQLLGDNRHFDIGDKVFFYGEKYYIVGIEYGNTYKSWIDLHLSKTMNDVMYKDDGLVVDSREVKGVIKC